MKKTILLLSAVLSAGNYFSQAWSTGLNAGTGLKLGTLSNHPLDFYTNGTKRMILGTQGELILDKLALPGKHFGLVMVNENGEFGRLPGGVAAGASCGSEFPWTMGGNYPGDNTIGTCNGADFILKSNSVESVFLKPTGLVGIGINNSNPSAALDVSDNSLGGTAEHFKIYGDLNGTVGSSCEMRLFYKPGSNGFYVNEGVFGTSSTTKFRVASTNSYFYTHLSVTGNIGATGALSSNKLTVALPGGATPTDAIDVYESYSSKVNFRVKSSGNVYAREINVQLANFPDYVFSNTYNLKSIESLEKYIQEHKHLPGVPSATEIETNGANLGDLSKIQMEKIEELTLYVIELKKELDSLKKQVNNN